MVKTTSFGIYNFDECIFDMIKVTQEKDTLFRAVKSVLYTSQCYSTLQNLVDLLLSSRYTREQKYT